MSNYEGRGSNWNRAARRSGGSRAAEIPSGPPQPGLRSLFRGMVKPFIIKVQVSLATTHDKPQVLAYNQDRSLEWTGDADPEVLKLMGDKPKAFFWAMIRDGQFSIDRVAADQDW